MSSERARAPWRRNQRAARPPFPSSFRRHGPRSYHPPQTTLPSLTEDFARGWNKLPTELKLRIFSKLTGAESSWGRCFPTFAFEDKETLIRRILRFAKCTPEFKMLAEQTLYNELQFKITSKLCLMPPPTQVRFLSVSIDLRDPHRATRLLESLQENRHGLRLKHMEVVVVYNSWSTTAHERTREVLDKRFGLCARSGQVKVEEYFGIPSLRELFENLRVPIDCESLFLQFEEVEQWAMNNITFSAALLDAKEISRSRTESLAASMKKSCDADDADGADNLKA